ncbi:MAG TPA: malto-oligosyltrehalose trehalohydrolase [Chitinophagaceae bacterium]
MRQGAVYTGKGCCRFTVWAPEKQRVTLHIVGDVERKVDMQRDEMGYFSVETEATPGTRYLYITDEEEKGLPDPASMFQPDGVHGSSQVIDLNNFKWTDQNWKAPAFAGLVLYELHIGTFTEQGTFSSAIEKLDLLTDIGVNAIEIMPVSQFPGNRNWGYDGVYPYAVQNTYGGPEGLMQLVDACHSKGIAVFLDVVYNHQGPEGNYLGQFAPYFTDHYKTAWGQAINFDGEWSDGVRWFYVENALYWLDKFHIDGLRFDAVHSVYDFGAVNFWEMLHNEIRELGRKKEMNFYTIAESDLNAPRTVQPLENNGYGFSAQWLDDFHHAVYVMLDKEGRKRYQDFGDMRQVAKAYMEGFVHSGEYVQFRKRHYGKSSAGIPGNHFVAFINNHDQSGNRIDGARLCALVDHEYAKLAAAMLLLAPYVPMLFMGEEYGEQNPFFYFISHSDQALVHAVQEGRRNEFKAFYGPDASFPDPQSAEIFERSKLDWSRRNKGRHQVLLNWHRALISLRKTHPALKYFEKEGVRAECLDQTGLILHRNDEECKTALLAMFNISDEHLTYFLPGTNGSWDKLLDSTMAEWRLENTSTNNATVPSKCNAGEMIKLPARSVVVVGKGFE